MEKALQFFRELSLNNRKDWFEAHREEWYSVRAEIHRFAAELISRLTEYDPDLKGLAVSDCTYRINRDIRFSHDKSPYKTWASMFIAPHGKKSGYAGYYLHMEGSPDGGLIGSHLLFAGLHAPAPHVLRSVREEIVCDGDSLRKNIEAASGFSLCSENMLSRVPAGFPKDSPYSDLLRLREVGLQKTVGDGFFLSPDLLDETVKLFAGTVPFVRQLNRAVRFAYEDQYEKPY